MKRSLATLFLLIFGCFFLSTSHVHAQGVLDSLGLNKCNAGGATFGVDTMCEVSCSGEQIDLSSLKSLVPAEYQAQFNDLCSEASNKCCAQRGPALCAKAAERVGVTGSCKPSCASGEVDAMTKLSGLPSGTNPCSPGATCCIPENSSVQVVPLTGSGATALKQTQTGISASPAVVKAAPSPGYGLINPLGSRSVPTLISDLIKWISGLSGTLFMLYLLWGGFEWMTSMGDAKKTAAARNRIVYAVLGIVIIFISYFAVDALIGLTNIPF